MKLDRRVIISLISLFLVIFSFLYFKYINNPPKIANIFVRDREGEYIFEIPETVPVNVPFKINVKVNSNKQNVNAVGLYLRFDPEHLQLLDFDTSNSFCQFYPEKTYENSVGLVSLACGSPHPGFSGENDLITLIFMPKLVSATYLQVDPKSQILLSDGKGTNILSNFPREEINILNRL